MSNDDQNNKPNKLRDTEQQIVFLGQLLHNLREDDRINSLIKTTTTYLQEWFDYPFIWIAIYDESNKTFYGKGGLTPDGDKSYLSISVVIKPENILEKVVNQLCPIDIANLREESRASEWQEVAIKYNIQGSILLPICYKETCLGLVLLGSQLWGYLLTEEARAKLLIVIGELGILLFKNTNKQQNKTSQTSTESLLQLLENVRCVGNFNKKLEAVVDATHKFVSPDRTNIYWLAKEGNYFWCRMSNHLINISNIDSHKPGAVGITVQKLSDVYQALSFNQVVWVSEADSSLEINAQDHLLQYLGIKSFLVAPIIWQKDLVGFLSVESHDPRIWLESEKNFLQGAAGLLALVAPNEISEAEDTVKQIQNNTQSWQLRDSVKNQQKIPQKFKEYLNILAQTKKDTNQTQIVALKQIASILQVPLAIILSCHPDKNWAEITPETISDHQFFEVVAEFPISLEKDILAELALAHNSYLILKADDLPPATRQWLIIPDRSKVFVMALHTNAECQPTGIVILADYEEKNWTQINLNATEILIYQLAWWQSQQQILHKLESNNENLHNLNWYKHSRLEEIHRMSTLVLRQIRDLGIPASELTQTRYKLLLQQLDYTANSMTGLIKQEQWDLHISIETMPISNLLRRVVERVDNFAKQQELWIGIHEVGQSNDNQKLSPTLSLPREKTHPGGKLVITGDIVKIELVFHELLVAACKRSLVGDRVDIWYKPLDNNYLEVSITDHGIIEPQLLAELNQYQSLDPLFTHNLNKPPGLHLVICKMQPKLIIHGGAGSSLQGKGGLIAVRNSLSQIVAEVYALLLNGASATEAVVRGCEMLEDEPRFNAGTGSVLQSDGQIRMSASMMDGSTGRFSGVINVSRVKNPIEMALFLQDADDRVLSDYGAAELARELELPIYNGLTDLRLNEWTLERKDNFKRTMAGVVAEPEMAESAGRGTIGVVALDGYGKLAAGTSTGGKGFERIGRVSDSAMPAGNYATSQAAVSCTGIGEDIIDECLAAKVVVRVTDGMSLQEAMQRSFTEAKRNNRDFGAIALDATGAISYGKTCEVLLAAYHNGENIGDTLEWNNQELIGQ